MLTISNSAFNKAQLLLCIIIGTFIVSFLYVFKLFGIYYWSLIAIFLMSLFFLARNVKVSVLAFFLHVKIIFYLVTVSMLLAIVDFIVHGHDPHFNDLIRVSLYFIYFSWAGLFLSRNERYKDCFEKLALAALATLIILGLWEFIAPASFNSNLLEMYSEGKNESAFLVSGPIRDSNSYSGMIVILFFLWSKVTNKTLFNSILQICLFVLVGTLVNFSASRLGTIMFILSSISIAYDELKNGTGAKRLFIISSMLVFFAAVCVNLSKIVSLLENSNAVTVYTRVYGAASERTLQSNQERLDSIANALNFSQSYFHTWGPGMINFSSAWSHGVLPHNIFLFIYAQYGIFSLIVLCLLYLSWKRAVLAKEKRLFCLLVLFSSLLVNALYYPIFYLVLLYIDLKYIAVKRAKCCTGEMI